MLDNCEHLADVCATLTDALARGCPRSRVLATSREPLAVAAEVVVAVEGLELPGQGAIEGEQWLLASEAGALFVDRARRARADFFVGEDDAPAIAQICERLDGIGLALELAAARTRMMSVQAIAEGLSDRFRLLVGTDRVGPPRHQGLVACIDWSWGLLSNDERRVLLRLAVLEPSFTLAAAEAVNCGDGVEQGEVLGLLTSLVDKSLVHAQASADRFRLHETIRAYSRVALDAAGERSRTRDRHLDHFYALAKATEPSVYTEEMPSAVRAFQSDLDNYRAALDWTVESKQFETGCQVIAALGPLFYGSGWRSEALARSEGFLAAALDPRARAEVLNWAWLYAYHLDPARSVTIALELSALGRSLADDSLVADGLNHLAASQLQTDPDECLVTIEEALPLALRTENHTVFLSGLVFKSFALMATGRPADALAAGEQAMRGAAARGWLFGTTFARSAVARAAVQAGSLARALEEAEILAGVGTELSDPLLTMSAEAVKGAVHMYRGEPGAAEALERARDTGEAAFDLANLPGVKALWGQHRVRLGQISQGYEILKEAAAEKTSLTGHRDASNDALLAEVAVWRGGQARRPGAPRSASGATAADGRRRRTLLASCVPSRSL